MKETTRSPREAAAAPHLDAALRALGVAPEGPHLAGTPERVAHLWAGLFSGLDPANAPDLASFPNPSPGAGMVVAARLTFHSMCAHHLLPFFGRASVAYLPGASIVGLGVLPRLVEFHARRPTLQEDLAAGVAADLERAVAPRGVAVLLVGRHLCMEMRGARKRARVETLLVRGAFETDAALRDQFLSASRGSRDSAPRPEARG
jgi:GTP cyclohydrolase I